MARFLIVNDGLSLVDNLTREEIEQLREAEHCVHVIDLNNLKQLSFDDDESNGSWVSIDNLNEG
jgi:hypothetical protein